MLEEVFVEDGMVKEEIKVREYGWWTSRKPLAIASNGAGRGPGGENMGKSTQCKM
jgi:hypothetical protein